MKQRISRALHNLGCVVCNPITTRRRRRFAADIRDEGHAIWAGRLADDARRERLRRAIDSLEDATPWERDLLMKVGTAHIDGKRVVMNMPPQQTSGALLVAQAERLAQVHRDKFGPKTVTADEYAALKSAGQIEPKCLYVIKGD